MFVLGRTLRNAALTYLRLRSARRYIVEKKCDLSKYEAWASITPGLTIIIIIHYARLTLVLHFEQLDIR